MSFYWADVSVSSLAQFVALFEKDGRFAGLSNHWFRGEGKLRKRGSLLPSISRAGSTVQREWGLYQRFRQNASAFLPHSSLTAWDWMFYMRHYGIDTRLLDWSESALVALYFAVEKPDNDNRGGVVWCLDPVRLNELAGSARQIHCAGLDATLDSYTIESVKTSPDDVLYQPLAFIAPRSFPRLVAQQGVFTVTHRHPVALDAIRDDSLLARVRVPAGSKSRIRSALQSLGYSRLSLYPELQSLAVGGAL